MEKHVLLIGKAYIPIEFTVYEVKTAKEILGILDVYNFIDGFEIITEAEFRKTRCEDEDEFFDLFGEDENLKPDSPIEALCERLNYLYG